MTALTIGELSAQCKVKIPTIRYYEQIGLLRVPGRTAGNRRQYDEADAKRLAFIRHARELGFDIESIRIFLLLQELPEQPCGVADQLASERLADVNARLSALTALKGELERMLGNCRRGRVSDCHVIETLADHSLCQTEHA